MKRRAASVVFCVQKPGGWDVLLLRRCYRQDWTTPGGYADTGETFYEALKREFREETGVMFLPGDSAAEHVAGAGCPQLSSLPKENCMHYLDSDLKKVALRLYVHFSEVPWSGFQANEEIDSCALLDLELLKYSVLRGTPLGLLLRNCVQQSFSCLFEQICVRKTKRICLVRHSEAAHNVSSANKGIQDPQLTAYGERKACNLKGRLEMYAAELILTSPLQRACQTACILSCGHTPVKVIECLKERGQTHACSRRSNMSILRRQFPQVDWSYMWGSAETDIIHQHRESSHDLTLRAHEVLRFVLSCSETDLILVSHDRPLREVCQVLASHYHVTVDQHNWRTCECRAISMTTFRIRDTWC